MRNPCKGPILLQPGLPETADPVKMMPAEVVAAVAEMPQTTAGIGCIPSRQAYTNLTLFHYVSLITAPETESAGGAFVQSCTSWRF
jgi:hypothetical protein